MTEKEGKDGDHATTAFLFPAEFNFRPLVEAQDGHGFMTRTCLQRYIMNDFLPNFMRRKEEMESFLECVNRKEILRYSGSFSVIVQLHYHY